MPRGKDDGAPTDRPTPTDLIGPGAFRLALAVTVLVSHMSHLALGRPAVMIFFMLSGFWVSRLYSQRGEASSLAYLFDRLFRVWPLMAICAIGFTLIFYTMHLRIPGNLFSTLALYGLASRRNDVVGVVWSLDMEVEFYAALPLFIHFVSWLPDRFKRIGIVAALTIGTVVGTILAYRGIATVLAYIPVFASGAVIWFSGWRPSPRTALISIGAFVVLTAGYWIFPQTRSLVVTGGIVWWRDIAYQIMALTLVGFVARNVRVKSGGFDRMLGDLSFPLYLVHFPIITLTRLLPFGVMANKVAAVALSFGSTLLLYVAADRPIERLRYSLRARRTGGREPGGRPASPLLSVGRREKASLPKA